MSPFFKWLLVLYLPLIVSSTAKTSRPDDGIELIVLGIAQDGGYPHAGCRKSCCMRFYGGVHQQERVSCLGLIDHLTGKVYLLDATPDFPAQWHDLRDAAGCPDKKSPDGIFLTHAHIGHYTGLMYLGREVLNSDRVPVYAMPRMDSFLRQNGPWRQLVQLKNIEIRPMQADSAITLNERLRIRPILVPHRDEFSETVGFRIETPAKTVLFIPDIDKWERWNRNIVQAVQSVDYAFLDATFYKDGELPGRNMADIPHPFVQETLMRFEDQSQQVRHKIYFIHLNHTNPLIWDEPARDSLAQSGFQIARTGIRLAL